MVHVCQFFHLLFDIKSLKEAGFAMNDSNIRNVAEDIIAEDSFAQFYGVAVLSMGGNRVRRNLNRIMGYPKLLDLLNIPEKAPSALRHFQLDCGNYKHIMDLTKENPKSVPRYLRDI